ncbi:MAG TPA: amidohydrolase family protein [Blastocatellia bacterium]|jgi:imidazolonepropionase-like amidohydrolase
MKAFALLLAALTTSLIQVGSQPAPTRTIAITGVTLIDGTGAAPRPGVTVIVSGNRISDIVAGMPDLAGIQEVIDGKGKFLIPGLWDMHTHLAYVGDVSCTTLVAYGVTSVRDPGGALDTVDWFCARIEQGSLIGPRIFRAGPVLDGSKPGSQDRLVMDTADDGRRAVSYVKARGVDFIKVHNGAPPAAYFAMLAEARRQGLAVVGHIPIDVDPGEAIDAGHQSVEHIVSLFEGPVRRKVAAGMTREQALAEFTDAEATRLARKMVAKGTWFDPTLVFYWYRAHQWEFRAGADPRERYVTSSARAYQKGVTPLPDNPDIRRALVAAFERFLEITRILHREGVRFLVGTDFAAATPYPGSSVHEELAWLVKAGLTPMEALVAGTRNGAEAVGRLGELGTIEKGKFADLALLDANPLADITNTQKIAAVVANGRLFRREALDKLLAQVAKDAPGR